MPNIQMVPMAGHSSQGDTYIDGDGTVDAAGNRFSLLGQAQPGNGNNTYVTLRKIAPNGVVVGEWTFLPSSNQKIDKANLLRSGQDVIVEVVTHEITSIKPRLLTKESGVITGVFVTNPQFELEEGGAGAWQPTGGQEVEVDYGRIEEIVNRVVEAKVNAAKTEIVANMISKTQWAFVHGLNEHYTIAPAPEFRNALFAYLKNAAANPIANVVAGLDEWGEDRRQELIATIREANGNG
jgi:hypothetical protein